MSASLVPVPVPGTDRQIVATLIRYVAAATSLPSRWLQRKAGLRRAAAIPRPSDATNSGGAL